MLTPTLRANAIAMNKKLLCYAVPVSVGAEGTGDRRLVAPLMMNVLPTNRQNSIV